MNYEFWDVRSKKKICVSRKINNRDDIPTYEEVVNDNDIDMSEAEYNEAKWERVFTGGTGWQRGKTYRGSKGNWGSSNW